VSHDSAVELLKEFALYVVLINVVSTPGRLRWLLLACMIGGLSPAWGAYQNYRDGTNLVEGFRARWVDVYADPNHLAMAMVFLVPVALTALVRGPGLGMRAVGLLSLVASSACIVITHSRGGALGLALALLLWAVREKKKARALTAFALLLVGLAALAPKSFWNRTETVTSFRQDASAMGRVHAWEVAAAINRDRPILGVGAGAFRYAWPLYAPVDARGEAYVAHNVFLEVLGDLGALGFFLFLGFVSSNLAGGFRAGREGEAAPWMRAVYAGAVGYLLCDMSAGYVTSAHFFFIFSLLGAGRRLQGDAAEVPAVFAPEPLLPLDPAGAP
jgi:O-antigen ligase